MLIVDRLFVRPAAYRLETLENNNYLNISAFLAWAIGAAVAILADRGTISTLTNIGALDALLLSAVIYFVVSKFINGRNGAT